MMTNRTAALYCVYNDDIWLNYSYSSIYGSVDAIYFFVSDKPWMGPVLDITEVVNTINALPDPDNKKRLVMGNWDIEIEQRNASLAHAIIDGFDIALIIDADELYEPEEFRRMLSFVKQRPEVDVWHMFWWTYWKNPGFRIEPIEPYHPPVFTRLGRSGFVETRNLMGAKHDLIPPQVGMCHHMSYARNDDLIRRKINAFSHARQIPADWYDRVWKGWDENPKLKNLHPVIPSQYGCAIAQPNNLLPSFLRNYNRKEFY